MRFTQNMFLYSVKIIFFKKFLAKESLKKLFKILKKKQMNISFTPTHPQQSSSHAFRNLLLALQKFQFQYEAKLIIKKQ